MKRDDFVGKLHKAGAVGFCTAKHGAVLAVTHVGEGKKFLVGHFQ